MDKSRSSDVLNRVEDDRVLGETSSGMRMKVNRWKSRGTDLMRGTTHSMTRGVAERTVALKRAMLDRASRIKSMLHETLDRADRELHSNPGKWACIAAGAAFTLGMIGRELRHHSRRSKRLRPELIIIETA